MSNKKSIITGSTVLPVNVEKEEVKKVLNYEAPAFAVTKVNGIWSIVQFDFDPETLEAKPEGRVINEAINHDEAMERMIIKLGEY